MPAANEQSFGDDARVRFDEFELDRSEHSLRRAGHEVRVQRMPLALLELLMDRAGALVTRAEIRACLWPAGTHVDFEHGVNTAIKKLRRALGDDAHGPRFIETLPGRGYRFTASVSTCARAPQRARAFRSLAEEFSARAAVGAPLTSRELAALRQLLDASSAAPASESGAPFPHAA